MASNPLCAPRRNSPSPHRDAVEAVSHPPRSPAFSPTSVAQFSWTQEWLTASCPSIPPKAVEMKIPLRRKTSTALSFDSQDSHQSFRIAADRSSSTTNAHRDRNRKLEIAGALELCTEMMRGLLVPIEQRTSETSSNARLSYLLRNDDAASLAASVVEVVSEEMQSKSLGAVRRSLRERQHSITDQERWLADLASKDRRHPEVVKLTNEVEEKRSAVREASRETFKLKCDVHEAKIEVHAMTRAEREANADARRLREVCKKYGEMCDENRQLNRLIQNLQGTVRVVCQIPTREDSYLEAINHRELTVIGQKNRNYSVDAVVSGQPSHTNMDKNLEGLVASFLDGMDVSIIGMATKEKSCFNEVIVLALDTLITAVDDRFYHASHDLEFELYFVTSDDCRRVTDRTSLASALDAYGDAKDRLSTIEAWMMDLLSRNNNTEIDDLAHLVLKIHAQTQHKLKESHATESTMTFVQIHPHAEGKWMNKEIETIGSALMEISSKREIDYGEHDSVLLDEILRQNGRHRLYTLFMELSNAEGHEKTDTAALALCSKIVSARMVDGKALKRRKMVQRLGKEIAAKDQLILEMEEEREHLAQQGRAVHSDINHLCSEISCLKKIEQKHQQQSAIASEPVTTEAFRHTSQNKSLRKSRKQRARGIRSWMHFPSRHSISDKRM